MCELRIQQQKRISENEKGEIPRDYANVKCIMFPSPFLNFMKPNKKWQ